jgi:hypothetical protein
MFEMMNPIPLLRYERKLVPEGFTPESLLALVRQHPALFREVYPERCVNNPMPLTGIDPPLLI